MNSKEIIICKNHLANIRESEENCILCNDYIIVNRQQLIGMINRMDGDLHEDLVQKYRIIELLNDKL